jgi:outer membrane protein OmpA-like peptidoglycan-associated protein
MKARVEHNHNAGRTAAGRAGLVAVLFVLALPLAGWGYFQDLGLGVRPLGMGEAFTGVADDSNTVWWNSAGLADLNLYEVNAMYSSLYTNLNARLFSGETDSIGFHDLGVVRPFDPQIGTMAVFWSLFNSRFYRENTFILSYGREVDKELFAALKLQDKLKDIRLNAGLNLKVLNWAVEPNEYTQSNPALGSDHLSKTGVTADLGLLAALPYNFKAGLSFENIIPADVGVTTYETVPFNFRAGVSYLYSLNGKLSYWDSLLAAVDFTHRSNLSDVRAGLETWFFHKLFGLRFGTTVDSFSSGLSLYAPLYQSNIDMRLDYAFIYPYAIKETYGSHRIALIVRWGKALEKRVAPDAEKTAEPELKIEPEVNLAAAREKELAEKRAQEEAKLKAYIDQLKAEIEKVRAEIDRVNELIKLGKLPSIQFQSGKAVLLKGSFKALDQYGEVLQKYPQIKVRLEGHTDSTGKSKPNLKLSQQRVESVKEYLLGKFGLNTHNIIPIGFGNTRPIADNKTEAGRAANRRVDIKVLIPSGVEEAPAAAPQKPEDIKHEPIKPEDTIRYEDLEKLKEKLKIYEMQMNPKEVEEMFQQQQNKQK